MKQMMRAVACGLLGTALLIAAGGAVIAEEEDELTFEQKIIHSILGGGSGASIDYRERSPLVIPPSRDLPAPETTASVDRNPAWPKDPDLKRTRPVTSKRFTHRDAAIKADDSTRLLRSELDQPGARPGQGRVTSAGQEKNNEVTTGRPMLPSALGYTGGIFGTLFGSPKEEKTVFTGEPERSSLTSPPPGYQTPSPAQPYGVKEKAWIPKAFNPFDRGTHDQ